MSRIGIVITALIALVGTAYGAGKQGGLVLQFDDGWTSWATLIAPELQAVGGKATGFVNNKNLKSGRITAKDLLALQNTYQWEIGTHTWDHLNAPVYVRKYGLEDWLEKQLARSTEELRALGLNVRSLVFPFNAYTPEIAKAVQPRVDSFRRSEKLAVAKSINPDKSVPGTAIDMANYIPPELLIQWIDMAAATDSYLFLYGHRILPDNSFATGTVVSVTATSLTAEVTVSLPEGTDLVLVPDITRRRPPPDYFRVQGVSGNTITVDRPDLTTSTKPGATFMIGEAYSTRLSDFRAVIKHASERMNFYTLREVSAGRKPASP
jgi:peptidoglycan/xylan/chitin deacetylase (PgdA/CDA1 family)